MESIFQSVRQGLGGGRRPGQTTDRRGSPLRSAADDAEPQPVTDDSKYWSQERFTKLGVRGNFLPLAAQPKNMDLADWLAHQCSEQYRMLEPLIKVVQEKNGKNNNLQICNPITCPSMSAGRNYTYTWLNSAKEPVRVPAIQYISLVQRWIVGKLSDNRVFPCDSLSAAAVAYASATVDPADSEKPIATGPTSLSTPVSPLAVREWIGKQTGFPENFLTDVRTIFRQMFRIYAHLYHSHWVNPFWHVRSENPPTTGWTDLNSCFVNFIIVAKLYCLLSEKDMEPMQALIDLWVSQGNIPKDAVDGVRNVNQQQARVQAGNASASTQKT